MPLPPPSQFFLSLRRLPPRPTQKLHLPVSYQHVHPFTLIVEFCSQFASQKYSWPISLLFFGHEKPIPLICSYRRGSPFPHQRRAQTFASRLDLAAHSGADALFLCHLCTDPKCSLSCSALCSLAIWSGLWATRGVRNILCV